MQEEKSQLLFDISITGINEPIKYSLEVFTGQNNIDLLEWIDHFNELSVIANWQEATKMAVLKAALRSSAKSALESQRTADAVLKKLINKHYPASKYDLYSLQLHAIKKKIGESIPDYHERVQSAVKKVNACLATSKLSDREIRSVFLKGLPRSFQEKLQYVTAETLEEVAAYAEKFQELEDIHPKFSNNTATRHRPSFQHRNHHQLRGQHIGNKNTDSKKQCKYHKENSNHTTEECRFLQNNSYSNAKSHQQQLNSSKPSLAKPSVNSISGPSKLLVETNINGTPLETLVDTGSSLCVLSSTTAASLKINKIENLSSITLADSSVLTTEGECSVLVKIPCLSPDISFKVNAVIVSNLSTPFILGMDFLIQNEVVLDFARKTIAIQEFTFSWIKKTPIAPYNESPIDIDTILISDHSICTLDATPANSVSTLLKKYPEIIGDEDIIGHFPHAVHEIPLKDPTAIVSKRPFRIPYAQMDTIKAEIDKLIQLNIIRPSRSPFSSPAFIVSKKNGKPRLVVDYRLLNQNTVISRFPLPRIEDILYGLNNQTVFSQLDLNSGYYQVSISEESIEKTAFSLPFGHFEFLRMPFGLASAPMTFQRIINGIFSNVSFTKCYMDDILVHSSSEQEHCAHLEKVFLLLKENGLTINPEKCNFMIHKVNFLGYEISGTSIRPSARNLESLKRLPTPTSKKGIRSILGSLNFFRNMIPSLSQKLEPISSILANDSEFSWLTEHQLIINEIVDCLIKKASLFQPDYNSPFVVYTDASDLGVGSVILQGDNLIGCFSKKLNSAEKNYTVTEKEALSIVLTLQYYRPLLFGREIIIYSDHSNLQFENYTSARIVRYKLFIQEFNPRIVYIPGNQNQLADSLSRQDAFELNSIDPKNSFPLCKEIIKKAQSHFSGRLPNLVTADTTGALVLKGTSRLFIPPELRLEIVTWSHGSLNHTGATKTYDFISKLCYWPNAQADVVKYINNCTTCQLCKPSSKSYGTLQGTLTFAVPFDTVSCDLLGPFSIGKKNFYCLTIIDACSRLCQLCAVSDITGTSIARTFDIRWLCNFPRPNTLICDQGPQFKSAEFRELMTSFGITLQHTIGYNPTGNSICERLHGSINNALRTKGDIELQSNGA